MPRDFVPGPPADRRPHGAIASGAEHRALASVGALNGIGAAYDNLKRYDIALGYYKRALTPIFMPSTSTLMIFT